MQLCFVERGVPYRLVTDETVRNKIVSDLFGALREPNDILFQPMAPPVIVHNKPDGEQIILSQTEHIVGLYRLTFSHRLKPLLYVLIYTSHKCKLLVIRIHCWGHRTAAKQDRGSLPSPNDRGKVQSLYFLFARIEWTSYIWCSSISFSCNELFSEIFNLAVTPIQDRASIEKWINGRLTIWLSIMEKPLRVNMERGHEFYFEAVCQGDLSMFCRFVSPFHRMNVSRFVIDANTGWTLQLQHHGRFTGLCHPNSMYFGVISSDS